jgi:hypothetical protein
LIWNSRSDILNLNWTPWIRAKNTLFILILG